MNGTGERPILSTDRITQAALDLARREGLAGVSMRRVAGALGVEPMSLYYHVPSKAALMVLMADRSISLMPAPDSNWPWDEQLVELMLQTFLAAVANPALFPVLSAELLHPEALPTPSSRTRASSLGLLERILSLLDLGGVPPAMQVNIFRGLIGLVLGFVAGQIDGLLPPSVPAQRSTRRRADQSVTVQFSLLMAMRPALMAADPAAALRCNLELIIHGIKTLDLNLDPPKRAGSQASRDSEKTLGAGRMGFL